MKYYCLFFILISLSLKAQVISFSPEGPMDKSLPNIEIKIDETGLKPYADSYKRSNRGARLYIFYVDKTKFESMVNFVAKKDNHILYVNSQQVNYGYGAYHITYSDEAKHIDYMFSSSTYSYPFFKEILPLCTTNESLYEEIDILIKRID